MKLFEKILGDAIPVVAELGVNHEGDVEAAARMIELAAAAGADAVKLQSYTAERYASKADPDRFERVRRFALTEEDHRRLFDVAERCGIPIFSTPLSEDWVAFLAEHTPVIKIASGDIDFEPVIRTAAATGLPLIMSTGLATQAEIDQAVRWVEKEVGSADLSDRLLLMHCVSAYPTPLEEAGLGNIGALRERYGLATGYSNHVIGLEACVAAVALGADALEIHFTDQKHGRTFRDHEISADPDDLTSLVRMVPHIKAAVGAPTIERQSCEIPNLKPLRKGIVAAEDIPAGTVLDRSHLMFARPAAEFSAAEIDLVVGRKVSEDMQAGQPVYRDSLIP